MKKTIRKNAALKVVSLITAMLSIFSISTVEAETASSEIQPIVIRQLIEEAKKNNNWKVAVATGKHEQVVFMNVSPFTNPSNEIGMEVHAFDQVILIVEGKGNAILNGKTSLVKAGDMIFIPEGTPHNVTNSGGDKELKLVSFYSDTDIPNGAIYMKKADEPKE